MLQKKKEKKGQKLHERKVTDRIMAAQFTVPTRFLSCGIMRLYTKKLRRPGRCGGVNLRSNACF